MVLPGLPKDIISKKVKKKDLDVIITHAKEIKSVIKRKKDMLTGKVPELEFIGSPDSVLNILAKVLEDVQEDASSELLADILALEVNARELMESIDQENEIIIKFAKKTSVDFKDVQDELQDEFLMGKILEHQINLLFDIHTVAKQTLDKAGELHWEKRNQVGRAVENLDDIASYLDALIREFQVPNLAIIYNMLRLSEWPRVEAKIAEIAQTFERLDTKTV